MPAISLAVVFEFAASHRLFSPDFSDEQNRAVFGKCSNPNGHGHNYVLDVSVSGEIEPKTGMLLDAGRLKSIVQSIIIDDLDHRDLNKDVPWLQGKIPTSEVVAAAIFERLAEAVRQTSPGTELESITLHETRRISVTVSRKTQG